jgi:hypothetical protein
MSLTTKILIWAGILLVVGALGFMIYSQINNAKQQAAIQQQIIQQKTLVDGLVQSANQYTTKSDLNNFIQQNTGALNAIQQNLSSLGAQITAANVVTADSNAQTGTNIASTSTGGGTSAPTVSPVVENCPNGGTVTCPSQDPYGYQAAQQNLTLNEDFPNLQVPFGTVSFSAWQQKPWSLNVQGREYRISNVIGTDENQRVYVDNQFVIVEGGKTYQVPIKLDQTKQVYPSAKFYWWNPQLVWGLDAGISLNKFPQVQGEFAPSVSFGVMSYGQYKTQPTLSVLQVGAAYESVTKQPALVITPVAFNLGTILPLVHNTFLAPSLHISTNGTVYGEAGLRLEF